MAGGTGLQIEQRILNLLADGPKSKIDMRRELGWSLFGQHKVLDTQLQRMRVAGLVEAVQGQRGFWQLREGVELCPHCRGKGVVSAH